jgi:hypothetical protein
MKLFKVAKDGGPESHTTGLFVLELKRLFSIVFLHFEDGSRDAYHTHAFNAISWIFKGKLVEHELDGTVKTYRPSLIPIITTRDTFHKVVSEGDTWAFTLRGPWLKKWREYIPSDKRFITLTNGRKIVA